MQLSSNGYVQRSAAQWSEIIARYRLSGLGSRDFCAAEGLVPRTFEKWERRLRRKETKQGQFVETDIKIEKFGAFPPIVALPPKDPATSLEL